MRFMVIVKADKNSEAGALPDQKILAEMGKFNEELVKAGVMGCTRARRVRASSMPATKRPSPTAPSPRRRSSSRVSGSSR